MFEEAPRAEDRLAGGLEDGQVMNGLISGRGINENSFT
jgi:hypothetical protein